MWLRMIEPTLIEERFDKGDDGALIMGGQVSGATKSRQEPGGARRREIVADRRQP